jgi:hypothetical protein
MTEQNDNANLEALLRADATNFQHQHIANDDFSDQVMARIAALPATAATTMLSAKQRFMIIASATLLAVVIAITAGAGGRFLIDATMDLATKTITPDVLTLAVLLFAALVMAVSAARSE